MRSLVPLLVTALICCYPAAAAADDWDDCEADNAERNIAGCTRIIVAGTASPHLLAIALNNRGVAYKARGETLRAFADYTEALRLNPAYARALYNRGLAHMENKTLARALEDYDAALQVEPTYAKALASRGVLLAQYGEMREALGDFAKAFKIERDLQLPPNPELAKAIVDNSDKRADREQRVLILTIAIKLKSNNAEIYDQRAAMQMENGAFNDAVADLNEAVRLVPKEARYLSGRCSARMGAGDLRQAAEDCNEAIRINARSGPAYRARGELNIRQSKLAEAERDLTRALQIMPGNLRAYALRAQAYELAGQRAKAIADYRAASAVKLQSPSIQDVKDREATQAGLKRLAPGAEAPKGPPPEKRDASKPPEAAVKSARVEAAPGDANLKAGQAFRDCPECPELIVVPVGEFMMGSPLTEAKAGEGEGPQHRVKIAKPFAVGKYEVLLKEFEAFVKATDYKVGEDCFVWDGRAWKSQQGSFRSVGFPQTENHPVTCISWVDAQAYVAWLARTSGKSYRLITEAEWEYVARAKTSTRYYFGDDADDLCTFANVADQTGKARYRQWVAVDCSDGHVHTAPAGSFKPNGFGLYDVHGNISEWVQDCYAPGYQDAPSDGSASKATDCQSRVFRGGSWIGHPKVLRSASRLRRSPDARYSSIGFRVARELSP